eukprot:PLAT1638.4.p1 GENE.PLAT1638.4~~PLAT1638.4.p1  ORF type:complete len:314 (-),score=91.13 PLAT1638.4:100-1041(-)
MARRFDRTRWRGLLLSVLARSLVGVASIPLYYLYGGVVVLLWQGWNLGVITDIQTVGCGAAAALKWASTKDAPCLAAQRVIKEERKVFRTAFYGAILSAVLYVIFTALAPGVPLAAAVVGGIAFPLSVMLMPFTETAHVAQRVAVLMVEADTDALVRAIEDKRPLSELRTRFGELQQHFDAARLCALTTVVELPLVFIGGLCHVSQSLLYAPNPHMLLMGSLTVVYGLLLKLPAAATMSKLLLVPQHISRRYALSADCSDELSCKTADLLTQIHSANPGWLLGDVPITSELLTRIRFVAVPAISFVLQQIARQ